MIKLSTIYKMEAFGKKSSQIILAMILFLAFILRFWQIDVNPPGIMPDEAEFGYAAYTILHTGKTHYGESNPFLFSAPGDYYPPVYSYVLMPFIQVFGLNIVVERLPSVLFGTFSCLLLFMLVKQLFKNELAAVISAFLMAINPWALFYSRQGRFEMIAIFLTLLGMVLFLEAVQKKKVKFYIFSAISFGLSLHANDATKVVVPLVVVGLFVYSWKDMWKIKRSLFLFTGIFAVFFLLVLKVLLIDGQLRDYTRATLDKNTNIIATVNAERMMTKAPLWMSSIFHNKVTVISHQYLSSYTNIFSLQWFFINGHGHLQESIGRHGQYLLFELPFFFIGIFLAFKKRKQGIFLIYWIAVANIPGAITEGNFFPYRSILILPVPLIFSGLGMAWFWEWTKSQAFLLKNIWRVSLIIIIGIITISFLFTLYFDFPVYSSEWRYHQKTDALKYAQSVGNSYNKIFIAGAFAQTFAFMNVVDPKEFQNAYLHQQMYHDVPTIVLGKYVFGSFPISKIATPSAYFPENSLVIADGDSIPNNIPLKKTFLAPDLLRTIYAAYEIK